jgi:hypothetical protein
MSEPDRPPASQSQTETGTSAKLIQLGQIAGAVTAIIGVAVLAYSLVKPGPAPPPPAALKVTVGDLEVNTGVTLYDFLAAHPTQLERARKDFAGVSGKEFQESTQVPGITAEFTVNLIGPPGRTVHLARTLYRTPGDVRVAEEKSAVGPLPTLTSHAGEDVRNQTTWVQEPVAAGTYFIEVEVQSSSQETLAHKRSRDFRVG